MQRDVAQALTVELEALIIVRVCWCSAVIVRVAIPGHDTDREGRPELKTQRTDLQANGTDDRGVDEVSDLVSRQAGVESEAVARPRTHQAEGQLAGAELPEMHSQSDSRVSRPAAGIRSG